MPKGVSAALKTHPPGTPGTTGTLAMDNRLTDELYPRHVKAICQALRNEAVLTQHAEDRAFLRECAAKVREIGEQCRLSRKYGRPR